MRINRHIETLHDHLESVAQTDSRGFKVFRRMFAVGIVSFINEIIGELTELNEKLDTDIDEEALGIKFDLFLSRQYWSKFRFFSYYRNHLMKFGKKGLYDVADPMEEINQLVYYLPDKDNKDVIFNEDQIATFRRSMSQFCDNDRLSEEVINFALDKSLTKMLSLLSEIQKKTENPSEAHYLRMWNITVENYISTQFEKEYKDWKEDNDDISFSKLKEKQMQEVVCLLQSGFLQYRNSPSRGDINRRTIVVPDEVFAEDEDIPDNINADSTRLEYFAHWADKDCNILVLDYKKLGRYIFKNNSRLTDEQCEAIVRFDKMLDLIHEDIAKEKLELKPYLKRYEENLIGSLINDCAAILNSCQPHLKKEIRSSYLREFLSKMLDDDDMKYEAREKLQKPKTRNKYLCQIIACLSFFNVFKVEVVKEDLAKSLSTKFVKPNYESIIDYIEEVHRLRSGALFEWTKKNYEDLIANPYNPFKGLFVGR